MQRQVASGYQGNWIVIAFLLFVIDHRLRMKEVASVMKETESQRIIIGLCPGVNIRRWLIEVPYVQEKGQYGNKQQGQDMLFRRFYRVQQALHGSRKFGANILFFGT